MKRIKVLSLACILLFGLAAFAAAEEPAPDAASPVAAESVATQDAHLSDPDLQPPVQPAPEEALYGDWYGILRGLNFVLTLQEDGTYTLVYPEVSKEPTQGTWTLDDGFVYLDNEKIPSISVMREVLSWTAPGVLLEREARQTYAPAKVYAEAVPEDFSGYWESTYINIDGALLRASDLLDDTFIYIEGTNAALGGSIFGDVIAEFTFEDGAMIYQKTEGNISAEVKMQLLEDGILLVTLTSDAGSTNEASALKLLLAPAYNEYAASRQPQEEPAKKDTRWR
ncbi:MAG: hypothetical protein IKE43_02150 [Coriobacteriales bacterium]|nr:hypothetical protein [Coriobacteriales bacterium]